MNHQTSITQTLVLLWSYIWARRRGQFWCLLGLMVFVSFAEVLSIGSSLPFLAALAAPNLLFESPRLHQILQYLNFNEPSQLILPMTIFFGGAALFAGVMRLILLWASTRLSFAIGAELSSDIYRRTLYQSYSTHCLRNSSELINGITTKSHDVIYGVIMPAMTLIGSSVMLIAILIALLSVDPIVALIVFGGFGLLYGLIIKLTQSRLLVNSVKIARNSTQVIKSLQEGLGGIRDILIDGNQNVYCNIYRDADLPLRRAQGNNLFINQSPRYGIETLGMIAIACLAYMLCRRVGGINEVMPFLGFLALGAQRLLPVLQQTYSSWVSVRSHQISLQDILGLLEQPLPHYANDSSSPRILFKNNITLRQLSFRYGSNASWVLKDINITINKGDRVGFIGKTGSGKSTLLDIVMGLLEPSCGVMEIDGAIINSENRRSWQSHIAHVPQVIYLADSSIEENIAFGVPKSQIDSEKVKYVAKQAEIASMIEGWNDQYKTIVGERGIRLSGGQRQRIGIARALYKNADVIIFDEATSALDNETEQSVMHSIDALSSELTVLIIAHRISTLKGCDRIIELDNGGVRRDADYHEIALNTP
jgi:ATP-binding cassette subfamily B protein